MKQEKERKRKKYQDWDTFEHSGQLKCPLALQFLQDRDPFLELPPYDWERSSIALKLKNMFSLIIPCPLHFEHAINLRSPHLLHMPRELWIYNIAHISKTWLVNCHNYTEFINTIVVLLQTILLLFTRSLCLKLLKYEFWEITVQNLDGNLNSMQFKCLLQ